MYSLTDDAYDATRATGEQEFSIFLWLPCLWLFFNASRVLIGLSLDVDHAGSGGFKAQATYFALIFLGIFCLMKRNVDWNELIRHNFLVILFFFYMSISLSWSDYPFISLKRFVKTVGILMMAFIILTENDPSAAFKKVLHRTYSVLISISALFIFIIPSYGIKNGVWLGITSHKNILGEVCCIGSIYLLTRLFDMGLKNGSKKDYLIAGLGIIILFNSNSMTSMIVFTFSMSLFALFNVKIGNRVIGSFLIFIYAFGLSTFFFIDNLLARGLLGSFFAAIGRDMTFTGRAELWEDVIKIAMERPWFGWGYEAFWIEDIHNLWEIYIWRPNQAHSGYVDSFTTLGIIGLVFLFLIAANTFINASRQIIVNQTVGRLRIIYLIDILWFNFSESSLCTSATSLWVLFIYIITRTGMDKPKHMDGYYPHEHIEEIQQHLDFWADQKKTASNPTSAMDSISSHFPAPTPSIEAT
ncbi:MAG: O-antigen ligase family protein [Desulfobulbaceae bacterium]|nr:O-antigen ligase family protein [Desulfobulbaceae bacterium]